MNIQKISSAHLKEISKLKLKKYREETNSFIIESEKILIEALNSDWEVKEIYLTRENFQIIERLEKTKIFHSSRIFELNEKDFKKLSNEVSPSGVAALVKKKRFNFDSLFEKQNNIIPVFEKISDPGNLGTCLRTADWFGFKTIVLSEGSVEFTNPKVVKSSMGSIFHLNIFDEVNLKSFISLSKKNEYKIFGTSTSGKNFLNQKIQLKSVLIFGNESRGISKEITELCDELIKIPSLGSAESLNLAISTSIFFYELKRDELID